MAKDKFKYEVLEEIAILGTDGRGFTRKLRKISYNGQKPVYDIRVWSPDDKFGKGIILKEEAFQKLVDVIKEKF